MQSSREPYVKPEVVQFAYEIDPRVTLAGSCKDFQVATGPAASGCKTQLGGACRNVGAS
jgi:hypothetical protein